MGDMVEGYVRAGSVKLRRSRIDMRTSWNIWGSILREIYDEMGMRLENRTFNSLLSQSGGYKLDVDYVHLLTDVENRIVAEEADTLEQQVISANC